MTNSTQIRRLLSTAVLAAACMIVGCASSGRLVSPNALSTDLDELTPFVAGQSSRPFKGSGLLLVRVDKAEYRGRMDIVWRSDADFSCVLYDPLGATIAKLQAVGGKTTLDYGDASSTVDSRALLHIPGILPESPITFRGFVRILCGRIPWALPVQPEVDSLLLEGRRLWFHFSADSGVVRVAVDKRSGALLEAVCTSPVPRRWKAAFNDFRDGLPRRTRIELDGTGSFEVRYDRIIFLTDSTSETGRPRIAIQGGR